MRNDPRKGKSIIRGNRAMEAVAPSYSLDEAFDLFYSAKKAEGMRERTLKDYVTHWRYFRAWLGECYPEITTLDQVTNVVLREYVGYMAYDRTKYDGVDNRVLPGFQSFHSSYSMFRIFFLKNFQLICSETMVDVADPHRSPKGKERKSGSREKTAL
ncbi:hypothetical protein IJ21_15560 [Paenibacillus sp. 32O-W]|uniref:hypothetical protein n=1 Tax=Paenibacillus sp. 32O-W TaxID=1695218 RepID=UPI0007225B3A|nr:hypothetical protein [Paenibacillus sp. 32O-W]ALS26960.1 hypothetical protein IJ21_15560 [Paenibacillus sp. 32O-W]